jgi:hypothetical protein
VDRCEAVEQELPHNHGSGFAVQPLAVAERRRDNLLVEPFRTRARFQPHLRQQCALRLTHLGFRRAAVCRSFIDAGICQDGLGNRITNRKSFCPRFSPDTGSAQQGRSDAK